MLIDEISLASDSVLERLNSVFEWEWKLVIAEKASETVIKIKAHENFGVIATMNPSGDYGKKELSPALRNWMTEIWVESYFDQQSLIKFSEVSHWKDVNIDDLDLLLIIKEKLWN